MVKNNFVCSVEFFLFYDTGLKIRYQLSLF